MSTVPHLAPNPTTASPNLVKTTMDSFNIPWKCLDHTAEPTKTIIAPSKTVTEPAKTVTEPPKTIIEPTKPHKTFAQAVNNLCDIPLSQLPQPVVKGDRLAIEIPENYYLVGLEACKHNLHGRILWPKGSTPLSVAALKEKLSLIWKDLSKWGIISLGKGFYEFTFSSLEDVRRVRTSPSWNLNPGLLKLFAWSRDFNPKLQNNTSVQVWVRIYGLSQEYWQKNILFTIASSIGTPICTDAATAKPMHERTFGQFVRVLVDIDLLQPLRYKLLVERKGFAFFVDLDYEHIPDFCNNCKVIGHQIENCKRRNKEEEMKTNQDNTTKKKSSSDPKPVFVQVNDGRKQQDKTNEVINVEKEVINVEDFSEKDLQPNQKKDLDNIDKVHKTPDKTPEKLIEKAKTVETVLSPNALLKEQDIQLEQELNEHLEPEPIVTPSASASSTQGSFVKDTQAQIEPEGSSSHRENLRVTPDRVIQDMNFLNQSWANMVEVEEEVQNCIEDTEKSVSNQDDGFQVVMSQAHKRDFNVILGAHEHRGRFCPGRAPMNEFQSWTDAFNLIHLPTRGAEFTWNNGRGAVSTLIKQKSDHFPLLLEAQLTSMTFASHFKFMKMWTLHPDCKNIVEDCWKTVVLGCPMFILSKKLKILKDKLKTWNKECFGNVHSLVSSAELKLQQ
ncbi:hypothetical protein A2U01_0002345, partial [Trifolium medium]|nr:hypothetical protein [Trifolium medium]